MTLFICFTIVFRSSTLALAYINGVDIWGFVFDLLLINQAVPVGGVLVVWGMVRISLIEGSGNVSVSLNTIIITFIIIHFYIGSVSSVRAR